jgi:DinB family protein
MTTYLDEAFAGPSWHGPSLLTALRGVTPKQAAWRPGRGRHNIWELVVHAAYWKHVVRQRLLDRRAERFPLRGTNWFVRPSGDRTWSDDVRLLMEEHERLREVVKRLPPRSMTRIVAHGHDTAAYTIRGIAAHDLYHAGQIQMLKRLQRGR